MIYCNVQGGLANMLFPIMAGKSLAIDKGVDVAYPNLIGNIKYLNSENYFNPRMKHGSEYMKIFDRLNLEQPINGTPAINFPFHFERVETPKDNFIINGFFQSEKYFNHNRSEILEFLKVPDDILVEINNKYGSFLNKRTTSIHIRRGDYIRLPSHHPFLGLQYYLNAIDLLKNETDVFIVFSDDIPWCKENIKIDNVVFIENEYDYIEIYLMSMCSNQIISNSSFSLWAAWMNKNNSKVVIAPKIWFGPAVPYDSRDVIPNHYIKL